MTRYCASISLFMLSNFTVATAMQLKELATPVISTEQKQSEAAFSNTGNFITCGSDITKEIVLYALLDDFKNNTWWQIEQKSTEHSKTLQTNKSNIVAMPTKLVDFQNLRLTCKFFCDTIKTFTQDAVIINLLLNASSQKFNTIKNIDAAWNTGSIMYKMLVLSSNAPEISNKSSDWLLQLAKCKAYTSKQKIIAELLIKHCIFTINDPDLYKDTLLLRACRYDNIEIVKLLIDNGANINHSGYCGEIPLHKASFPGNLEITKLLISSGSNINQFNAFGRTPLHLASGNYAKEVVMELINNGANVNHTDDNGDTPLHNASFFGHTEIVKLLIDNGANINWNGNHGETALHRACFAEATETVKLLVDSGAEINKLNQFGNTPLQIAFARCYTEIVKLLTENGAQ